MKTFFCYEQAKAPSVLRFVENELNAICHLNNGRVKFENVNFSSSHLDGAECDLREKFHFYRQI
jgi:hypothetical protein